MFYIKSNLKWWNTNRNNKNLMWKRGMKKIVNRRNYVCVIKLFFTTVHFSVSRLEQKNKTQWGENIFEFPFELFHYSSNEHIFIILFQYYKIMLLRLEFRSEFWLKFQKEFPLEFLQNSATICFKDKIQTNSDVKNWKKQIQNAVKW